MCPKRYGRPKKRRTLMPIRRVSGACHALRIKRALRTRTPENSAAAGKDRHQLLRRNHFELGIRAVARLLIGAPPSKVRKVAEAGALHVFVGDFDHQLGPQRLPRQVLALAPAALATRHAMAGFRWGG